MEALTSKSNKVSRAIYPGTFDPVTYGHMDLMIRASVVFEELIVAVADPLHKDTFFDYRQRRNMVELAVAELNLKNVRVDGFKGLMIDYAKRVNALVVVRGLRVVSDFEYEFQMALTNRAICKDIEVLFMMPSQEYAYLSSSLIKEAALLGADISAFVPEFVIKTLNKKAKIR